MCENRSKVPQEGRIRAVIPSKANQVRLATFDREAFCGRKSVERLMNRLELRRIATIYEKYAANDQAEVTHTTKLPGRIEWRSGVPLVRSKLGRLVDARTPASRCRHRRR